MKKILLVVAQGIVIAYTKEQEADAKRFFNVIDKEDKALFFVDICPCCGVVRTGGGQFSGLAPESRRSEYDGPDGGTFCWVRYAKKLKPDLFKV